MRRKKIGELNHSGAPILGPLFVLCFINKMSPLWCSNEYTPTDYRRSPLVFIAAADHIKREKALFIDFPNFIGLPTRRLHVKSSGHVVFLTLVDLRALFPFPA